MSSLGPTPPYTFPDLHDRVYASVDFDAKLTVKDGSAVAHASHAVMAGGADFPGGVATLDGYPGVGIQVLPKGTSFDDAVKQARSMSAMTADVPTHDVKKWHGDATRTIVTKHEGAQAVAVFQAAEGAFQLVPMQSVLMHGDEWPHPVGVRLAGQIKYDADDTFGDRFKSDHKRFQDHVGAHVKVTRLDNAMQAAVTNDLWVDLRTAKSGTPVAFST